MADEQGKAEEPGKAEEAKGSGGEKAEDQIAAEAASKASGNGGGPDSELGQEGDFLGDKQMKRRGTMKERQSGRAGDTRGGG